MRRGWIPLRPLSTRDKGELGDGTMLRQSLGDYHVACDGKTAIPRSTPTMSDHEIFSI